MQDQQPQEQGIFPRIFRFITEKGVLIVVTIVSFVVLTGIALQALTLQETLAHVEQTKQQRLQMTKELAYWQDVVRQYDNYRDAYFKIATLQYELGEADQAQKSLEKVLALDPNFEQARVLGDKISAQ